MCVICDRSYSDHVGFGYEESLAAPICCDVDRDDDFFVHQVKSTTASAPALYRRGTRLAPVTFLGTALVLQS